jgi:general secretion pathway protein D
MTVERKLWASPALCVCLATLALTIAMPHTRATAEDLPVLSDGNGLITIQFEDVELPVFAKFISKVTGRNFVFTDKISGTVTVVSPAPVSSDEAYAVFQSVLAVRGLTTIEDDVVTRIIPLKDARTAGGEVIFGRGGAGFATRLLPLDHVNVEEVASVLSSLVSKEGSVVPYPATNTLIVSDTAANLSRVADVVDALDIPSHKQSTDVIRLSHAAASTLAGQITEILEHDRATRITGKDKSAAVPGRTALKIVPDERTNSIIVMGTTLEIGRARELAESLDTALQAGDQRLHVYHARYADASDLVDTVGGMIVRRQRTTGGRAGAAEGRAAGGANLLTDDSDIAITADDATNSVIVSASAQQYQTIEQLLMSLDIERPQVFVETIIAEVSLRKSEALGFEWQLGGSAGDGTLLARSNLAALGAAAVNPLALSGLVLAATSDKTITLPDGTEIPAQAALFTALAEDGEIEVLSAPTLLTLDNQEAEIIVGENVPFITGQGVDLSSVDNVFTTVEREDVGIKLRITPQVAEGDIVVLQVEEEVSRVINDPVLDAAQVGPTTSKRAARTTVSVADGRTAVLGGLISNAVSGRASKVPLLGDIPWIGRLFRSEGVTDEKVNLILFLTPHVIRNKSDLAAITEQRTRKYEQSIDDVNEMPGDRYREKMDVEKKEQIDIDPRKSFPDWPRYEKDEL